MSVSVSVSFYFVGGQTPSSCLLTLVTYINIILNYGWMLTYIILSINY